MTIRREYYTRYIRPGGFREDAYTLVIEGSGKWRIHRLRFDSGKVAIQVRNLADPETLLHELRFGP